MRKIKFRAWNTISHKMISHEEIIGDFILYEELCRPLKRNTFMQWTGLLDKNGTEIYEGDLVYLENWNDHIPVHFGIAVHETREVSFDEGCFTLVEQNGTANCCISYMNNEFAEIVGNIYQNKDKK